MRRPWLVTAGLMLASAAAAAWSTYLHWLPCRGSMLRGSVIYEYAYVGPKFSAACERRMSADQGPWESELNVLAMGLAGVAWLTSASHHRDPLQLGWPRVWSRTDG
jgi:hypothetical protein